MRDGLPRHPRLRGRHPAAPRRVPRARAAPGPVARHRVGAGPSQWSAAPRALPGARGIPPRPLPGRRRPPGLQPHRRRARHRPQRARPGDGLAGPRPARRSRWAGSVAGALLASGAAAARRRASAAAASWLAATRPWRAAEVGPGMTRRSGRCSSPCPARCCSPPAAVQTSFLAPVHLLVVLGAWLVLLGVGWALLRGRVPWGVVAAVGGVLWRRCALALLAMSSTGPGRLLVRVLDRAGRAHRLRHRRRGPLPVAPRRGRLGAVGHRGSPPCGRHRARRGRAPGWRCRHPSSALVGLERALTAWNDQVGLLPWGLSRILGITVYLGIPADTAWWAAGFGAVLLGAAWLLAPRPPRVRAAPLGGPRLTRSAAAPAEDAAEHVADDAAGVEPGRRPGAGETSPPGRRPTARCRARPAACRRASRGRCRHRRPGARAWCRAGRAGRASAEPAAATLEHLVGEPGQHHRREDREQLPDQGATGAGATHGREAAEPVDDLVLLVAEDVARDGACRPARRSPTGRPRRSAGRRRAGRAPAGSSPHPRGRRRSPGAHRAVPGAPPRRRCAPRRGRPRPAARSGRRACAEDVVDC